MKPCTKEEEELKRHSTTSVQKAVGGPKATAKFFNKVRLLGTQLREQKCSLYSSQS